METKVEALQDNKVKVTVTVDAKEVDNRIKKAYKDFANKYNFPGFRKGKAPRPIIDNALGAEAVPASVTDDIVNGCYPLAIDSCDLYPVGEPEFGEPCARRGRQALRVLLRGRVQADLRTLRLRAGRSEASGRRCVRG